MKITLKREDFVAAGACEEGLALLDQIAADAGGWEDGEVEVVWDALAFVWALVSAPGYARWAIKRALLPHLSLAGADLRGANLFGADLTRADLGAADLRGADLSGADLRGANLFGADLTRADLTRADLTRADLTRADLTRADLTRADLTRADLTRADLWGARNKNLAIGLPPAEVAP